MLSNSFCIEHFYYYTIALQGFDIIQQESLEPRRHFPNMRNSPVLRCKRVRETEEEKEVKSHMELAT